MQLFNARNCTLIFKNFYAQLLLCEQNAMYQKKIIVTAIYFVQFFYYKESSINRLKSMTTIFPDALECFKNIARQFDVRVQWIPSYVCAFHERLFDATRELAFPALPDRRRSCPTIRTQGRSWTRRTGTSPVPRVSPIASTACPTRRSQLRMRCPKRVRVKNCQRCFTR